MNSPEISPASWLDRLPPVVLRFVPAIGSLLAGVAVAVVLHYLLYRVGLPSKPFIYVAF